MRITYRSKGVRDYWTKRWADIPADRPMENKNVYPLKYAQLTVSDKDGRILEAGCGAGRILRYYHDRGHDIVGMDFIDVAIEKLRAADATLKVEVGDITRLAHPDCAFNYLLAFGLYHNLERGLDAAVRETYRVLKPGGKVCASFRADNIQTRLTDWLADYRARKAGRSDPPSEFHKMNLTRGEFRALFEGAGFRVDQIHPVENMPILYKFSIFRAATHKQFDENLARKEGYLLSPLGNFLQRTLMAVLATQFCNIYVLIGTRPEA